MSTFNQMLLEEKGREIFQEHESLMGTYRPYVDAITEAYREVNKREIPQMVLAATVRCLDNLTEQLHRVNEATRSQSFGNFADYGYQLISAVMPNLVTNEIASIQPLKLKTGTVWYLSFNYVNPQADGTLRGRGKTGGANSFGTSETIFDPYAGPSRKYGFTTEKVEQELVGTVTGTPLTVITSSATNLSGNTNLAYKPIRAGSVVVTVSTSAGVVTLKDSAPADPTAPPATGTLSGTVAGGTITGTIAYATGIVSITTTTVTLVAGEILVDYEMIFEENTDNIGQVDIKIVGSSITAIQHKVRARYSLDAAYDLQQTYGIDTQQTMVATLSSLVRSDIDKIVMKEILDGATTSGAGSVSFDAQESQYVTKQAHWQSFYQTITKASNMIFDATQTVYGNFIIGGTNVANILETLPGYEGVTVDGSFSGPHVAGTFMKRWTFIKNPAYNPNKFVVGARGTNFLESGFVLAPYRALYVSPQIVLDDDVSRFGMFSSFGRKMVNPKFFVAGSVSNV